MKETQKRCFCAFFVSYPTCHPERVYEITPEGGRDQRGIPKVISSIKPLIFDINHVSFCFCNYKNKKASISLASLILL
jgi:hypothetical protein